MCLLVLFIWNSYLRSKCSLTVIAQIERIKRFFFFFLSHFFRKRTQFHKLSVDFTFRLLPNSRMLPSCSPVAPQLLPQFPHLLPFASRIALFDCTSCVAEVAFQLDTGPGNQGATMFRRGFSSKLLFRLRLVFTCCGICCLAYPVDVALIVLASWVLVA